MTDRVTIALSDGVADVRLARAEKLNALDPAMFAAISAAIAELGADRRVRAVVVSGEGRSFCVGIDLDTLANDRPHDLVPRTHGIANHAQNIAWGWRALPVPVIAAVRGHAFGAGFQIALGADIRIATADARFSMMEMRWGLAPDVAGIALLRGLVRDDVAREITYSARRIAGIEAAALGLVTRLADDPHAEAMALARDIAAASPDAVRAAKRLFNLAADADAEAILIAEAAEQEALFQTANHREAVAAGRAQRPPVFADWAG